MKLSTKGRYATRALLDLALKQPELHGRHYQLVPPHDDLLRALLGRRHAHRVGHDLDHVADEEVLDRGGHERLLGQLLRQHEERDERAAQVGERGGEPVERHGGSGRDGSVDGDDEGCGREEDDPRP